MVSRRKVLRRWVELIRGDIEKLRGFAAFLVKTVRSVRKEVLVKALGYAIALFILAVIFVAPVIVGAIVSAITGNPLFLNVSVIIFLPYFWLVHRLFEAWVEEDDC